MIDESLLPEPSWYKHVSHPPSRERAKFGKEDDDDQIWLDAEVAEFRKNNPEWADSPKEWVEEIVQDTI